jgi:NAD(P)-dependent dehydrogenase (short-subunit alcohol dehydrogenase family)
MSIVDSLSPARFAGQSALVTGAASGIGRATAILLAQQGARIVAADHDQENLAATVQLIGKAGGAALPQLLEVTSESAWQAAIDFVERKLGRLDILVNCAGIAFVRSVAETALDDWRRVLAVNLDGVFLGTRAGMRIMRKSGGGSIVNVSSASGLKAAAASSAYCASKAAVIMFTKAAALECVNERIRINAVAPAGVKTAMWEKTPGASAMMEAEQWKAPADAPIGQRFADPIEIARAIAFLASVEASYLTGSVLTVDAGYTA